MDEVLVSVLLAVKPLPAEGVESVEGRVADDLERMRLHAAWNYWPSAPRVLSVRAVAVAPENTVQAVKAE